MILHHDEYQSEVLLIIFYQKEMYLACSFALFAVEVVYEIEDSFSSSFTSVYLFRLLACPPSLSSSSFPA